MWRSRSAGIYLSQQELKPDEHKPDSQHVEGIFGSFFFKNKARANDAVNRQHYSNMLEAWLFSNYATHDLKDLRFQHKFIKSYRKFFCLKLKTNSVALNWITKDVKAIDETLKVLPIKENLLLR